jgi:hypothetical protein
MDTRDVLGYFKNITRCRALAQYEVLPCDKLVEVKVSSYPFLACVNIDDSTKKGSHWVGIYIGRVGSELEFMDSYGLSISSYPRYFMTFAEKNNYRVIESNVMLQSPTSTVCGHYVVYYMFKRLQGCSRRAFYSQFTNNLDKNDKIVFNFVKKLLFFKPIQCKYYQKCQNK